jgi:hypothetical protein
MSCLTERGLTEVEDHLGAVLRRQLDEGLRLVPLVVAPQGRGHVGQQIQLPRRLVLLEAAIKQRPGFNGFLSLLELITPC